MSPAQAQTIFRHIRDVLATPCDYVEEDTVTVTARDGATSLLRIMSG